MSRLFCSGKVWGLGVDDCAFQRNLLAQVFKSAGLSQERSLIIGGTAVELKDLSDTIVKMVQQLPEDRSAAGSG